MKSHRGPAAPKEDVERVGMETHVATLRLFLKVLDAKVTAKMGGKVQRTDQWL